MAFVGANSAPPATAASQPKPGPTPASQKK
jgi:hypothetical protein